jgi:hypothetical protein
MKRTLPTRITLLLALLAAALLLAVAGCGGDDDGNGGDGGDEAAESQDQGGDDTGTGAEEPPGDEGAAPSGDAAAAEQTLRDYIDGVVEGDGEKVCDQFTDEVRERLDQSGEQGCAELFDGLLGILSEEQKDELRGIDPEVEVNGDRATATVPSIEGGGQETVNLIKEGDEWKISTLADESSGGP